MLLCNVELHGKLNLEVDERQKLVVQRSTETPLKTAMEKRKAQLWVIFFHTLETVDVILVLTGGFESHVDQSTLRIDA